MRPLTDMIDDALLIAAIVAIAILIAAGIVLVAYLLQHR